MMMPINTAIGRMPFLLHWSAAPVESQRDCHLVCKDVRLDDSLVLARFLTQHVAHAPSPAQAPGALRPGGPGAAGAGRRRLDRRAGGHRAAARAARSARRRSSALLAPRIASILEQNHYRHIAIDERLSPLVFDRFLTALDGQHSYFLASDISGFERWRTKFGDMIHTGEIDPAYLIFNVFQQRNRERINYALKLLDTEPDWTLRRELQLRSRARQLADHAGGDG